MDYENLDNHQHGIHDYFKFLKYGFGRATDIASLHIRRGRISREQALQIVIDRDGRYPGSYLGKSLLEIISPLELSLNEFNQICDKFTNKALFRKNKSGELERQSDFSLTKINYDNLE